MEGHVLYVWTIPCINKPWTCIQTTSINMQEKSTSSIDLICKMEEIGNINPVLADLVMEAGYRAIDTMYSQVS